LPARPERAALTGLLGQKGRCAPVLGQRRLEMRTNSRLFRPSKIEKPFVTEHARPGRRMSGPPRAAAHALAKAGHTRARAHAHGRQAGQGRAGQGRAGSAVQCSAGRAGRVSAGSCP
jgi:hypothetical protein